MTPINADVVRSYIDAMGRFDLEAASGLVSEDVEVHIPGRNPMMCGGVFTRGRRRRAVRGMAQLFALGLFLTSCGGEAAQRKAEQTGESVREESAFTSEDIERIALGPDEIPKSTEYLRDVHGRAVLGRIWIDPVEAIEGGFVDAYKTEFQESGKAATLPGTRFVTTAVLLFEDSPSASAGLANMDNAHRTGPEGPVGDVSAEDLGEEAVGLEGPFDGLSPDPMVVLMWRFENLVLMAAAINLNPDTLMEIARTMDSRLG